MILDKDYGSQKSTTKQNDTSPEYGETFWFEIPSLKNMYVELHGAACFLEFYGE
jgi:hypothetical protein